MEKSSEAGQIYQAVYSPDKALNGEEPTYCCKQGLVLTKRCDLRLNSWVFFGVLRDGECVICIQEIMRNQSICDVT